MVDLNIGNIVTISLISIAAYAATKYALKAANISVSWL
jgi:hypothetical protein